MSASGAVTAEAVDRSLQGKRVDVTGYVFTAILLLSLLFSLAVLGVLVVRPALRGLPVLLERGHRLPYCSPLQSA